MQKISLATYLFSSLRDHGVHKCFGIPGDYILPLYKTLEATNGIDSIVGTHEPCSAFSADAYARINGIGALLLTYGVGVLNALNGISCAYAESSPVLIISGAPAANSRQTNGVLSASQHHIVKNSSSQMEALASVTDLCLRINNPNTAAMVIQQTILHTKKKKLPVYLEIPYNLMLAEIPIQNNEEDKREIPNLDDTKSIDYFIERLNEAKNPVLLIGVEVGRYQLQNEMRTIISSQKIPAVLTPLAKGILVETEDGCIGVYAGVVSSSQEIRNLVEESDLVLMMGTKITDVNCGIFTADLKRDRLLIAKTGWIGDGYSQLDSSISFPAFVKHLVKALKPRLDPDNSSTNFPRFQYQSSRSMMDQFLGVIENQLQESDVIVADTGDSCYGSLFMQTRRQNGYMAPLFYNTMGFAIPAALGIQLADPSARTIVLVGDGAFQMTGMETSTLARLGLDSIILIFNNQGFGMQRIFQDGEFNDLTKWNYSRIVDLVGGGKSWQVETPGQLADVLKTAREYRSGPSIIEVLVEKGEISTGLRIFSEAVLHAKTGVCPMQLHSGSACTHEVNCGFCHAPIWKDGL